MRTSDAENVVSITSLVMLRLKVGPAVLAALAALILTVLILDIFGDIFGDLFGGGGRRGGRARDGPMKGANIARVLELHSRKLSLGVKRNWTLH